jgi:hypothetical protein
MALPCLLWQEHEIYGAPLKKGQEDYKNGNFYTSPALIKTLIVVH